MDSRLRCLYCSRLAAACLDEPCHQRVQAIAARVRALGVPVPARLNTPYDELPTAKGVH
jgi:hypothetical protein